MQSLIRTSLCAVVGAALLPAALFGSPQSLAPIGSSPAQAATPQTTNGQTPQNAELAPDDVTRKISELVHAGKYAEAQQLTTGLLAVYPGDQRLVKTNDLLGKLMAKSGSAKPDSAQSADRQPPPLSGMDRVEFNSLIELARQAQTSTDLTEQTQLMEDFLVKSDPFVHAHPDQLAIWQLRVAVSISLNQPVIGNQAGRKMLDLGAADSGDPAAQEVLARLKLMGWLDDDKVAQLQKTADAERSKKFEEDQRVKYTFAVAHLSGLHYEFGHITITEDGLDYSGTDGREQVLRSNVREVKLAANTDSWGVYFITIKGHNFYCLPITEQGVADRTGRGKIFLPVGPIWHGVMTRWGYVTENEKKLVPGAPGGKPQTDATAASAKPAHAALVSAPANPESTGSRSRPAAIMATPGGGNSELASTGAENIAAPVSGGGMAVLHVCRPHRMVGSTLKPDVMLDGLVIASMENGHVVRANVAAGAHNVSVGGHHVDVKSPISGLAMAAGGEYWVRMDLEPGAWGAHSELAVMTAEQAANTCGKLKEDVAQEGAPQIAAKGTK